MKRWQMAVMLAIVLGSPFLLNGNLPPYASIATARAADQAPAAEVVSAARADDVIAKTAAEIKQVLQMGILAWFCYFVTSKAWPQMVKNFRDETKAQRDANHEEMQTEREANRNEVKAERDANRQTLDKIAGDYRNQYVEIIKLFAERDRQSHDDLIQFGATIKDTVRHCAEATAKHLVAGAGP